MSAANATGHQWGSSGEDEAYAVVATETAVVLAGLADSPLKGSGPMETQLFVLSDGMGAGESWVRYWPVDTFLTVGGLAAMSDGTLFLAASSTTSTGTDDTEAGDAWVMKLEADGTRRWTRRFGTGKQEELKAIALDDLGNIFVAGATMGDWAATNAGRSDAFLVKLDPLGTPVWTAQWGTPERDEARAIALDLAHARIFVSGFVTGQLPGAGAYMGQEDAFVAALDLDGNLLWTRQWGSSNLDMAVSVVADGQGGVFVGGGGGGGSLLRHIGENGDLLWSAGRWAPGAVYGLFIDDQGGLVTAGSGDGMLDGEMSPGNGDALVTHWSLSGATPNRDWIGFYGTGSKEDIFGATRAPDGTIHLVGRTWGALPGYQNQGGSDVALLSVTPP